ncbi:MAG: Uma2 family endonuclease [Planctomycetes bacterium]|nr:Uma2 family endonuclease [Planctomycetota bacterium]
MTGGPSFPSKRLHHAPRTSLRRSRPEAPGLGAHGGERTQSRASRVSTRARTSRSRGLPEGIVEFPSSRPADQRRDYQEKEVEYRELGVKEYWIIDRHSRSMTVYSGRDWRKRVLSGTEMYATPLLPGFALPLAKVFAVADKYREE